MFMRSERRRRGRAHRQRAVALLVTAKRVRAMTVGPAPMPGRAFRLALAGGTTLTYLDAAGAVIQESYGPRQAKVAELVVPPVESEALAGLVEACREARTVDVYGEYRLRHGLPVALESLTVVGDGIYVDLGARHAVNR